MPPIATGPVHWDWLFHPGGNRADERLWTWATDPLPMWAETAAITMPALRLADHRMRYLDFEGEVGGGRGSVRQLVTGGYELRQQTECCFEAVLRWSSQRSGDAGGLADGGAAEIRFFTTTGDQAGGATRWEVTVCCLGGGNQERMAE